MLSVPGCVVEQDPKELAERVVVAIDPGGDHPVVDPQARVDRRRLPAHLSDQLRELDRHQPKLEARVGARQRQQPLDQTGHPLALGRDVLGGGGLHLRRQVRPVREQAGVAPYGRERRS